MTLTSRNIKWSVWRHGEKIALEATVLVSSIKKEPDVTQVIHWWVALRIIAYWVTVYCPDDQTLSTMNEQWSKCFCWSHSENPSVCVAAATNSCSQPGEHFHGDCLGCGCLLGGILSHSPVVTLNLQIASHHPRDPAKKSLPEFPNSPKAMWYFMRIQKAEVVKNYVCFSLHYLNGFYHSLYPDHARHWR